MRQRRVHAGYLLSMLFAAACAGEGPPPAFIATDSAGVVLAVSTGRAWDNDSTTAWTLDPSPLLDLTTTGTGPAHEFFRVSDATRLAAGRIVVADRGSSQVRLYSPEGASVRVVGGEGEGPVEYQQIASVHALAGDSVAVYSWPTRLTVLGPDLSFARTVSLGDYAQDLHLLPAGFLATLTYPSVLEYEGESRLIREPVPLVRFSFDGRLVDTVTMAPGYEEFMVVREEHGGGMRPLFGKSTSVGVGRPDNATAAGRPSIVVGGGDRMAVSQFDEAGTLLREIRVEGYPLAVSAAEVQAERDARIPPEPPTPDWYREIVAMLPAPGTRPANPALLVDSEGCVWAGAYLSAVTMDEPRTWEVFDPAGAWLGTLSTPARYTVFEIGKDYVLGVRRDDLDVEHVELLRLNRGGR
ncbi:MAG: hypothetical protein FIA95_09235 [Gemmatimonadetes bacterium]|nr:hypothetical protein [Gemmatimonadota bacterium]